MGNCFAPKSDNSPRTPSANVVALGGELRRYSVPVTVSQVLRHQTPSSGSFFLCNSDRLNFNDYIPSLHPDDELEAEQIYFVLPVYKLQGRLAASELAALAVKANAALNDSNRRRKRKARISPSLANGEEDSGSGDHIITLKHERSAIRRRKMTAGSSKVRLATIEEVSVLNYG